MRKWFRFWLAFTFYPECHPSRSDPLSCPWSRHCFGAIAAPWRSAELLLRYRAVPVLAPPFRSPRKAAPCPWEPRPLALGARDTRAEQGESYVPQQSDAHRFHRQRRRKEGCRHHQHRHLLAGNEDVVEERHRIVGISFGLASVCGVREACRLCRYAQERRPRCD